MYLSCCCLHGSVYTLMAAVCHVGAVVFDTMVGGKCVWFRLEWEKPQASLGVSVSSKNEVSILVNTTVV